MILEECAVRGFQLFYSIVLLSKSETVESDQDLRESVLNSLTEKELANALKKYSTLISQDLKLTEKGKEFIV